MSDHSETIKRILDWLSTLTAVGALINFLPQIAAVFTIVWYGIRIWESDTVKSITGRPISNRDWIDTMAFRSLRKKQEDAERK